MKPRKKSIIESTSKIPIHRCRHPYLLIHSIYRIHHALVIQITIMLQSFQTLLIAALSNSKNVGSIFCLVSSFHLLFTDAFVVRSARSYTYYNNNKYDSNNYNNLYNEIDNRIILMHGTTTKLYGGRSDDNRKKKPLRQRSTTNDVLSIQQQQNNNNDIVQIEYDIIRSPIVVDDNNNKKRSNNKSNCDNFYYGVIGSDDSGMGAIAGPIVTVSCCCVSDHESDNGNSIIPGVTDSKELSYEKCLDIYNQIVNHNSNNQHVSSSTTKNNINNIYWSYSIRTNEEIDQCKNVQQATMDSFVESIRNVTKQIVLDAACIDTKKNNSHNKMMFYSIVDGHKSPSSKDLSYTIQLDDDDTSTTICSDGSASNVTMIEFVSRPWKHADSIVYTVALASILARVIRQQYMDELIKLDNQSFVVYQLDQNGGYPTRQHIAALHQYGPSSIHRISCQPVYNVMQTVYYQEQQQHRQTLENEQRSAVVPNITNTTLYEQYSPFVDNSDDKQSPEKREISSSSSSSIRTSSVLSPSTQKTAASSSKKSFLSYSSNNMVLSKGRPLHGKQSFMEESSTIRRRITFGTMAAITAALNNNAIPMLSSSSNAMTIDKKTGIALPDIGEIESSVPKDWSTIENPIDDRKRALSRLDTTDDAIFYSNPRFVEHVDEQAVQIMTKYITNTALQSAASSSGVVDENDNTISVLDLCSSWTSHIDTTAVNNDLIRKKLLRRVAGLGMNEIELKANPVLTEFTVQDLNANPILPYPSNSFDVVLIQLSIDYLIRPLEVCQEIGRVLKPNGTVHILYSNRLFLSKAVAIWTGADDIDHTYTVASYLYFCEPNLFQNIRAIDLSVRNSRSKNIMGDPMYVVTCQKAQQIK